MTLVWCAILWLSLHCSLCVIRVCDWIEEHSPEITIYRNDLSNYLYILKHLYTHTHVRKNTNMCVHTCKHRHTNISTVRLMNETSYLIPFIQ